MPTIDELRDKFENGGSGDIIEAVTSLLVLAGIKEDEASLFVKANIRVIWDEFSKLGFSLDNPLLKFLQQYNKSKQTIKPFTIPENWMVIHNLYAKDILTEKQLDFTCSEIDKPKILLNDNFWNNVKDVDKEWYIETWEWCSSDEPNKYILNDYVRLIFSEVNIKDNLKTDTWGNVYREKRKEGDKEVLVDATREWNETLQEIESKINSKNLFSTDDNIDKLRKCLIFSGILLQYESRVKQVVSLQTSFKNSLNVYLQLTNEEKTSLYQDDQGAMDSLSQMRKTQEEDVKSKFYAYFNALSKLISEFDEALDYKNIFAESAKLIPTSTTNRIIRFFNADVNLSDRDVLGRYQTQQGTGRENRNKNNSNKRTTNREEERSSYMNPKEAQNTLEKAGINYQNLNRYINQQDSRRDALNNIITALRNMNRG